MKARPILLSCLLVVLTLLIYLPAYHGGFIWDDDRHVQNNMLLRSPAGLQKIWFSIGATPQYYPLTHTTFWIEWHLWDDAVLGYHVVNVLLHIAAAFLVVRLLQTLAVPGAWLAGFVFALHPLHVESVAWISERKNTLSMVLLLASILVYWRHASWRGWAAAFVLFLGAVFSKTVAGAMPAIVVILLMWKNSRISLKEIGRLLPFFAVSVAAGILTGWMERNIVGAEGDDWSLTFVQKFLVANRALWWYAWKLVCPTNLAFSYERWTIDTHSCIAWGFVIASVIFAMVLGLSRKRLGGGVIAAGAVFGLTLFPALGFFNLYPQRFSFVADHFQYYADVAGIALLCAGATIIGRRLPRAVTMMWTALLIAVLSSMSYAQAKVYKNLESVWIDTIAKTPSSWLAYENLGISLEVSRTDPASLEEALGYLRTLQRLRPDHERVHTLIGETLAKLGRTDEAEREFELAIASYRRQAKAEPGNPRPRVRLAMQLDQMNRRAEATDQWIAATKLQPVPYSFKAAIDHLTEQKRSADAIALLEDWAAQRPDDLEPHVRLAYLYGAAGRVMDAKRQLQAAAAIAPDDPGVQRGFDLVGKSLLGRPATAAGG